MFQEIRPFGTTLQDIVGPDTISIVTQPTELDDFYHETIEVSEKESVTFITTDISLLFNQQRLMQASPLALDRLVNNLKSARPDSLKGFTDDQLASAVKSRYIQSHHEFVTTGILFLVGSKFYKILYASSFSWRV